LSMLPISLDRKADSRPITICSFDQGFADAAVFGAIIRLPTLSRA
jgi:hypothetical protein